MNEFFSTILVNKDEYKTWVTSVRLYCDLLRVVLQTIHWFIHGQL